MKSSFILKVNDNWITVLLMPKLTIAWINLARTQVIDVCSSHVLRELRTNYRIYM